MAAAVRTSPLRSLLVSAQLMLSVVLLIGAGLLMRTVQKFNAIPLDFNPRDMVLMNVEPNLTGKYDAERLQNFYAQLLERLGQLPEVQQVTISRMPPLNGNVWRVGMSLSENQPKKTLLDFTTVAPNYFEVMGIPIVRGRGFTFHDTDASLPVAVVNETAARTFWPGQDPIGKLIQLSFETRTRQVIGVTADMKFGTSVSVPRPYAYFSMWQRYLWPDIPAVIQIRTRVPLARITTLVQQQVQSLDQNVPVFRERTIAEQIAISSWRQRMTGMLIAVFAVVALLLAVIGVYSVVSYAVSQRTREFGIRMALGASPRKVLTVIVVEGGKIAVAGVTAGVIMALGFTRFLAALLYGIGARDPFIFSAVASGLLILAVIASYFPARRATRVDPAIVLRDE
jgi:predicted permease